MADIWEDGEGHVWLLHDHSGLTILHPETLELLTEKPIILGNPQVRGEELWFLSENQLCCLCFGQLRSCTFKGLLLAFLIDATGALWVSTGWGDRLYRYETPSAVWTDSGEHFTTADGLGHKRTWGLLETRDGTVWASRTTDSTPPSLHLCRYDGGGAFEAIPVPCGGLMECLMEDRQGRIWFGGWLGGGLSCYDGKQITTYTMDDGLSHDTIRSLVEDDAGRLWIGTLQGLCCFDGESFTRYGKEHLLTNLVHNMTSTKDRNGQLWFGTSGGVYRYDGKHFQQLTMEDGIPANQVWGLLPEPDGAMLIGTARGIVRYRPTTVPPPPVEIREVVADRVYRNPTDPSQGFPLQLTATQGQSGGLPLLTISYYALSFTTQKMLYSCILEGYDREWQDTWERSVRYEDLPVGEYTLDIDAVGETIACPASATKPCVKR